jgi:hypothetical protein
MRDGIVADWVIRRRERYEKRKVEKEEIFGDSDSYDFIGILPSDIDSPSAMDQYLRRQIETLRKSAALRSVVCQPVYDAIAD